MSKCEYFFVLITAAVLSVYRTPAVWAWEVVLLQVFVTEVTIDDRELKEGEEDGVVTHQTEPVGEDRHQRDNPEPMR